MSAPHRQWMPTISRALRKPKVINLYINERRVEDVTILDLQDPVRVAIKPFNRVCPTHTQSA
jgi:hypothetical protein